MRVWAASVALAFVASMAPVRAQQKPEFTAAGLASALLENGSASIRDVFFEDGKATIKPDAAKAMASVGELLQSDALLRIEIRVHTDNSSSAAASLRLSRSRAAAFKAYLVDKLGIAADRLTANGFGDTRPLAGNDTEDGRAQNRRVELVRNVKK